MNYLAAAQTLYGLYKGFTSKDPIEQANSIREKQRKRSLSDLNNFTQVQRDNAESGARSARSGAMEQTERVLRQTGQLNSSTGLESLQKASNGVSANYYERLGQIEENHLNKVFQINQGATPQVPSQGSDPAMHIGQGLSGLLGQEDTEIDTLLEKYLQRIQGMSPEMQQSFLGELDLSKIRGVV